MPRWIIQPGSIVKVPRVHPHWLPSGHPPVKVPHRHPWHAIVTHVAPHVHHAAHLLSLHR